PRQKKLDWWDRFQTADGVLPMIARSAVAIGIVGSVVLLGSHVGEATLSIYNALAMPVIVDVGGREVSVPPLKPIEVEVPATGRINVRALSADNRLIEAFDEDLRGSNAHYVYNIAGATPLFEWTAVYTESGDSPPPGQRPIGAVRWTTTHVDHVFEDPPENIQVERGSRGVRKVLSAAAEAAPFRQAGLVQDEAGRAQLIRVHLQWDATSSPHFLEWLQLGSTLPDFDALFAGRLAKAADDLVLLRFEQDSTAGDEHASVCERHRARAASAPDEPDLQYLGIRCMQDHAAQSAAFIAAQRKWPGHPWLTFAAASSYAEAGDYPAAGPLLEQARRGLPMMGDYLAILSARVRRLSADDSRDLRDLAKASRQVAAFAAIETGQHVQGTVLEPLAALARGELEVATRGAALAGDARTRVLRLVAGSDGATPAMIQEAFALPVDDTADLESTFVMYGLALRTGHPADPYRARIESVLGAERAAPTVAFIEQMRRGADPRKARALLVDTDLSTKLCALNAAVVMLGARAPVDWRHEVARGLFVGERQYIEIGPRRPPQTAVPAPPGAGAARPARLANR
ncbi:MAG TPA: hypothetical protein VFP37_00415, partial [Steroidobacteraceae bacterium]|nr:hypothetical protein [Steroidobacteraceae bacterium]